MSGRIEPVVMPKWGLAMQEGTLARWHVVEGAEIAPGRELCDIETAKIANAFEGAVAGRLRRRVAGEGAVLPVGALIAVVADDSVPDAEIDAFVARFQADFVPVGPDEAETPAPRTIRVGDRALNYLALGAGGTPVLFLHGFGGDLNNWMFNQPVLAETRATLALDLPGHGASSKAAGDGSPAALAAAVAGFLDGLGVERAHLVGHSLGGAVALVLALERPDACASLTLIASAGLGREIDGSFIDGFIAAAGRKDLKPQLEKLFADPTLVTRDLVDDVLKFKRLDGAGAALKAIAAAAFPGGAQGLVLRDRLAGLAVPVQVIVGAHDRIIPPGHAEGLPANVAVHRIAAAGHMPQMEAAGEVNRLIAALAA